MMPTEEELLEAQRQLRGVISESAEIVREGERCASQHAAARDRFNAANSNEAAMQAWQDMEAAERQLNWLRARLECNDAITARAERLFAPGRSGLVFRVLVLGALAAAAAEFAGLPVLQRSIELGLELLGWVW